MPLFRRFLRSLRSRGIAGTLRRILRLRPPIPPVSPHLIHPFDHLHGTDTSGLIRGPSLVFNSPSGAYKAVYLAISPSTLTHALTELNIPYAQFTFVDVGCGKGRALLIAAGFPFARLLGVELSPGLCGIARANLATQPDAARRATILTQDATSLVFPRTSLLLFLYDPFPDDALTRFLANLERQLRASPRETWLLYAANRHAAFMARSGFLELVYDIQIPLSPEDAAIDQLTYDIQFPQGPDPATRHRITHEHYTLYRSRL